MNKILIQRRMIKETEALLLAEGFHERESFKGQYELMTKFGILNIWPCPNMLHRGQEPTITLFCKFAEPTGASRVFNSNPYSGKWNHHTIECLECVRDIIDLVKRKAL